MKILWGTRAGAESWQEELITEVESQIKDATIWARANGFDRLRISEFTEGEKPNFARCLNL